MNEKAGDADHLPTLIAPPPRDGLVVTAVSFESLALPRRYEQGTRLGKGGMGEVDACLDVRLSRWIAMKVATTREPDALQRFVQEARVQGQLRACTRMGGASEVVVTRESRGRWFAARGLRGADWYAARADALR